MQIVILINAYWPHGAVSTQTCKVTLLSEITGLMEQLAPRHVCITHCFLILHEADLQWPN